MKNILVISTAQSTENVAILNDFVEALNQNAKDDFVCEAVSYKDLIYTLDVGAIDVRIGLSGKSVTRYDFVYFKSFLGFQEQAVALAHILKYKNIPFYCGELLTSLTTTKLAQYAILAVNNLPLPRTMYIYRDQLLEKFQSLTESLGLPFVMKAIDGKGGNSNFLIKTEEEYSATVVANRDIDFIFQEFIANSGDLRVLIVGSKIQLIIQRSRLDDSTHLNNTSQGASAALVDVGSLSDEIQSVCMKAASALSREIAGVDIMFEEGTQRPFILEVNASPQVGSGAFMDEKVEIFTRVFKSL